MWVNVYSGISITKKSSDKHGKHFLNITINIVLSKEVDSDITSYHNNSEQLPS